MKKNLFILTLLAIFTLPMKTSSFETKPAFSASLLNDWKLISDQVMGGHMQGIVTTENNVGFLQIAHSLSESERLNATEAQGIHLHVRGNNERYNLHLRTSDMWLPWQSFRSSFMARQEWQHIYIPFDRFEAYKITRKLNTGKLKRIGIVAIGRDFEADICIAAVDFYYPGSS